MRVARVGQEAAEMSVRDNRKKRRVNLWSAPGLLASNRLMWVFFSLCQAVLVGLALAKGTLQLRASVLALFGVGLCGAIYAATRGRRLHRPLGLVSNAGFLVFAALGVWKDRAAIPALEMGSSSVSRC